jgi:hypothetical protein
LLVDLIFDDETIHELVFAMNVRTSHPVDPMYDFKAANNFFAERSNANYRKDLGEFF